MISRKLLAALVGLSLATGTLGAASAQTSPQAMTTSASPSDTMAPATSAKNDTLVKKTPARKAHHARMTSKTHRKHLSLRGSKHDATKHFASKHGTSKRLASKPMSKFASKHSGIKVAKHFGKNTRVSHVTKRGATKNV